MEIKSTEICSYLQSVTLDSYVYATDSLLEELSISNSSSTIVKLSLKGCDVITDGGIRYLEGIYSVENAHGLARIVLNRYAGLKNLEYVDTSNCKVTDKGLRHLTSK